MKKAALGLVLVLELGCGSSGGDRAEPPAREETAPTGVETSLVGEAEVPRYLHLVGTLKARERASIAAGVSGKVESVLVERGVPAKKGAPLVRLDSRTAAASTEEARAQVEVARIEKEVADAECQRGRVLLESGSLPVARLQELEARCRQVAATVRAAEARLQILVLGLADSVIRAPFEGLVVERHVSVGEFVRPDTPVVTLLAVDPLRLELTVPEAEAANVRQGQPVEFVLTSAPDVVHRASISHVGPALRPGSRDLVVEALVPNPERALLPGQFAKAKLRVGSERWAVVPRDAVREMDSQHWLFVVNEQGRIEERLVQLGETVGESVVVRSGVSVGQHLVASPLANPRDGQALK